MQIKKSLKIPVHYDTTKTKQNILDNLTARITFCIRLISQLIDSESGETKIDRPTLRKLVKENEIASKTGLSTGFIDQCIDKVIWAWKSYKDRYREWEKKLKRAKEKIESARNEKEKEKGEKSLHKLLKSEPSRPSVINKTKTPCRIDYRTGKIEWGKGKFSPVWIHVSTLEKRNTIDIPLNPSQYHLNQLKNAEIDDFEIIKNKKNKKYYVHISITKVVEDKLIKKRAS